jgi:hypothetical protein
LMPSQKSYISFSSWSKPLHHSKLFSPLLFCFTVKYWYIVDLDDKDNIIMSICIIVSILEFFYHYTINLKAKNLFCLEMSYYFIFIKLITSSIIVGDILFYIFKRR